MAAATSRGAAADAASTDAGGAPSRMVRALSRVRDVLEPVGETLAVVSSVLGVAVGVMEIIQDVRYIVDSARGALDRGDGVDPPGEGGGLVNLADDPLNSSSKGLDPVNGDRTGSSVRAKLESKLIRTGERSYHNQCKLNCQTQRDIPFENLPEDVIHTIFSQLPLQDLVRTSALSSKWRSMCTICPKLRFDGGRLCGNDTYKIQQCTQKFIDNVNTVLQQHEGNLVDTLEVKIEFSSMLVNHLNNWSPWLLENSCKFFMLKHLKLLMFHLHEDMHNILSLASFLKAAPLVEKFEIDFNIFGLINDLETDSLRSLPSCSYNYLRDVCITGYQGDIGQLELVVHIEQNAPVLEVLTIDRTTRRGAHVNQHSGERPGIAVRRHLEGKILPTTKLEII